MNQRNQDEAQLNVNHRDSKSQRPWREIASDVLRESDHHRIVELAKELCDAIDDQVLKTGASGKEK
ncbi:MAG TPA: hypothetical protein VFO39_09755 [Candidatus Sulfotelmatobacter sp.]|nr:hypothetical protein [Candidatus Sulfotelmatobacter sp.]